MRRAGGQGAGSIWAKKKPKARPGFPYGGRMTDFSTESRGDFSFDGHRLSSLYRNATQPASRLILRYCAASSLQKYSTAPLPRALPPGRGP